MKRLGRFLSRLWHSPAVTLVRRGAEEAAKEAALQLVDRALDKSLGQLCDRDDAKALLIKIGVDLVAASELKKKGNQAAYEDRIEKLTREVEEALKSR